MCAAFDNRTPTRIAAEAWAAALADVRLPDAKAAITEHYSGTRDWIMPADVRVGVQRIRNERLAKHGPVLPNIDPDDVAAYQAERRRLIAMIADGHTPEPPRLTGPQHTPNRPTEHRSTP